MKKRVTQKMDENEKKIYLLFSPIVVLVWLG
jgi:hypothetical protein